MFWLVPVVVVLVFVAVAFYSRRSWAREHAAAFALLDRQAVEGVAAFAGSSLVAPLSGRQSLAWHLEVLTRERRRKGNLEEIIVKRVFEAATGGFTLQRNDGRQVSCAFDGAQVIERPVVQSLPNATLFLSSTSAFTPGRHVPPPHIARFLHERGLPMPTADSAFAPGLGVAVNERIIVPGERLWFAPEGRPRFGIGSIDHARKGFALGLGDLAFTAGMLAALAGAGTGMVLAMLSH